MNEKGWDPRVLDWLNDAIGLRDIELAAACGLETKATILNWKNRRGQPDATQVSDLANVATRRLAKNGNEAVVTPNMLLGWEALPDLVAA